MKRVLCPLFILFTGFLALAAPPNVVIVITDDQGYGDLACNGHPYVKTPNIDALHGKAAALDDYHVAPTCSPTRCALITGHWTNRTGVWHTINGRSMLRENEVTIGQLFKDAGYATGMFGKWHLGDCYPYRPEDRGFTEVYRHGGGGVGQTPDIWDNSYFDGHYFHNGEIVPAKGFCTDAFFDYGIKFIKDSAARKQPFLAYICTNAPHGPLHCPQKYMDLYSGKSAGEQAYYGMITNIDDNVGRTRKALEEAGVANNTIFIFTTDNGTTVGKKVFNAGMRGGKGSEYDGGHRVPLLLHWPAGDLTAQRSVKTLTHAVDIVPTLLDLCGVAKPESLKFDGQSLRRLLEKGDFPEWKDRFLITDSQRVRDPIKWRKSAVMSEKWRLINGKELYDIDADPGQKDDVAKTHPEQVQTMRAFYDAWWAELLPTFSQTTEIYLGQPGQGTATLTAHDWIQDAMPPWNQGQIRAASGHASAGGKGRRKAKPGPTRHNGHWAVKVIQDGEYSIAVRRWPRESGKTITTALPAGANVPGATKAFRANPGIAIPATKAVLRLNGEILAEQPLTEADEEVSFTARLTKGSHELSPIFVSEKGEVGCYYAYVSGPN